MARRSTLAPLLRVVTTVVMLAVLQPRLDISRLVPLKRPATLGWLLAAVAVSIAAACVSAVRWQRVLIALDRPTRLAGLISHCFAGLFVGNFLPSTIGGDIVRVSRLSSATGDSPTSFASVVLERLTGWIVLPLLTLSGLLLNPGLLRLGTASRVAVAVAMTTVLLLGGIVLAAVSRPRPAGPLTDRIGWQRFMGALHIGIDRFRSRPAATIPVILTGFAYQLLVVLAAFLGARALGLPLSPSAALVFVPAVAMLQVVPITMGGLGVREGALVLFLSRSGLGASVEQAIAFGLLLYLMNIVVSLIGAPAFAAGTRPATARV
ncbi:MAG TPA: lysylphosphatidylglycerol synthase transmembrane domain-containing protein [Acidimicrobiales bacterium]|nr:lysylphosphatidylglycerol synthase transmembrane domain-containing protein [Acidimicrobiales bacterium]